MYVKTFKMKHEPFSMTPDPRFLFRSARHQKALERLVTAVNARRGITAIIGEPGLGKSMLLRTMLGGFRDAVNFAWVFNTTMETIDLLKFICRDFGFMPKSENKSDLLIELYTFFIREYEQNRIPVIIVDEAQNLKPEALEEIRQLSNLETVHKKLVQIILSGQPALNACLDMPELMQLKQRISYKATLSRFTLAETCDYIKYRLTIAGAKNVELFSDDALHAVYEISDGIPRLINQVCDDALNTAAKKKMSQVSAIIVRELLDNGDVMKAPALLTSEEKVKVALPINLKVEKPKVLKRKKIVQAPPPPPPSQRRIIETKYDLFEAIDISELLSVV